MGKKVVKEVPTPKKKQPKTLKGGTETLIKPIVKTFGTIQEALTAYVWQYDDPLGKSQPRMIETLAEFGLKPEDVTEIGIKSALATQREAVQRNFDEYNRAPGAKPFFASFGVHHSTTGGFSRTTPPATLSPVSSPLMPAAPLVSPRGEIAQDAAPQRKERGPRPKGLGIIGTIVDALQKASKKKPVTIDDIHKVLIAAFPDRPPQGMRSTISSQVPNGLWKEKKIKVQTNGKGGFWI